MDWVVIAVVAVVVVGLVLIQRRQRASAIATGTDQAVRARFADKVASAASLDQLSDEDLLGAYHLDQSNAALEAEVDRRGFFKKD